MNLGRHSLKARAASVTSANESVSASLPRRISTVEALT
jgi:hypothetical protein